MEDQPEWNEEQAWVAAAQQDTAAFRPLYEKYYGAVFRYFVRRADGEVVAEELCSKTFFKALDKLNTYKWQGKPFGAWLFAIAGNELKRYYRDAKPIFTLEVDKMDCFEVEGEELTDYLPSLVAVLDQLSDEDLRLLELKYFEGLPFKELCNLLEIGESAAKMRIYRLLSKLKTLIIEHHDKA